MAAYQDLYNLRTETAFRNKIIVACLVAAEAIRSESDQTVNHANRVAWAKKVFQNPDSEGNVMFYAVIAANNAATTAQIITATDAAIQNAVNNAVNLLT